MLRNDALANNLADLNRKDFWSEIKNMNNCKNPLPTSIEWSADCIILASTFIKLLNCVSNSSVHACEYGCDPPYLL